MSLKLSAILMMAVLLASASGAAARQAPTAAATAMPAAADDPGEPVTLNAWVRNYTLDQDSPWISAKATLEARHPNVTVELTGYPYDELYEKLLLSKSGGAVPDVITLDGPWLGQFAEERIAANLDTYYADWDQRSDIPENFLAASVWKGSYYAVWLNTDVRLFLWNKDLFRRAGLDPETPPASWDEMISMAQQIQANVSGVWGVGFPGLAQEGTADRWYPLLFMGSGEIMSPDFSQATFNSDAGVSALQLYVDLVREYKVTPEDVLSQDPDDVEAAVFAGKYAMMISNVGTGQDDFEGDPTTFGELFGVAQIPLCTGCQPATGAGGYQVGVHDDSQHKDLAFELIDIATAPANITPFLVARQRVPTRSSVLADTAPFGDLWYWDQVVKAAEVAHLTPWTPAYPKVLEKIYTAIQIAIQGSATPKEALDAAAAESDAILAP